MVLTRLGEIQGLSGLLAARYCDRVWLTDKDPQVLDTLQRSVQLNTDVQDKVKVEKLVWGTDTRDELPRFDVVIASDTLYYLTAVEQLWKSVDSLLSRERCADGSPPLFILAHVNREKVIDSELHKVAQGLGFVAQVVPIFTLCARSEPVPSNEHVKKEMLRLFVFTRAQHVGRGGRT
ncbi:uncharacterized protein ACA1_061340 [Acanthamoeba castellanii str. Neff]|uniref:Calmodulin-lysine N-methyltransferase n=1 Tax=Acanthamoeba castellanii (strain ATCC 30010 / Neff) TaxID=1257118 RepID=L8GZ59_ACACF|nr:uncharacterized protein ACA1_061340 [Acanthamoeba castellanii str. Neff]ELR17396.1 hypothetical protein ACA1_061340 [Acanthamoeba castellanii str. Neff]